MGETHRNSYVVSLTPRLCDLSDSEPSAVEALSAWSDLAAAARPRVRDAVRESVSQCVSGFCCARLRSEALPLRFNDSALRVRRRHLKKAKEALRSLPKG